MPTNHFYNIALASTHGIGRMTARQLLNKFSSSENIFQASKHELKQVNGVGEKLASAIIDKQSSFNKAENILVQCAVGLMWMMNVPTIT